MRAAFARPRPTPRPAAGLHGTVAMEYRQLGRSGLRVSRLCVGAMTFGSKAWNPWVLDEPESRAIVHRALELGITFFDTADVYSGGASEEVLGRTLRAAAPRDRVVIATKVHGPMGPGPNDRGLSRAHVMQAVEASLRRLGTDYIDLYQTHRWDAATPIEETLRTLDDLVRAGKVRYIGASSMFAWQFCTALHAADRRGFTRFATMQNHYNLVYREEEREMIPLCQAEGGGVIPWSPLAKGFLAGNRARRGGGATLRARTDEYAHRLYYGKSDFAVAARAAEVARARSVEPAQVALAWLLAKPAVTAPIIGVSSVAQLEEAAAALALRLDAREIARLEAAYVPHPVLGHE